MGDNVVVSRLIFVGVRDVEKVLVRLLSPSIGVKISLLLFVSGEFGWERSGLFLAASDNFRGRFVSNILNKLWVMSIFGVF